ncbi:MAG TPA: sterol carrier protein domain-containing protein [Azospirillaceae bacterium]|nr:sterol carrier protein domain-containing protein [Azospirillaceae bacterium]
MWSAAPDDLLLHGLIDVGAAVDDWEEWMLRILDVPAALSARGYNGHAEGELLLKLDDSVLSKNNGQWKLTVADGKGFVAQTNDDCTGNIRLSSNSLAAVYSGYMSPSTARRMRRIVADDQQVAAMTSIFSSGYPYFSDRF